MTEKHWEASTFQCMNKVYITFITFIPSLDGLLLVVITLIFDVAMIKFIKNQSRVQPIQLSVWRSSNQQRSERPMRSSNDVIKATVPVQSTLLSTSFIIFFTVLSIYFVGSVNDLHLRPYDRPLGKSLLIVVLALQMPLILGLTVKNQKKNKRPAPPPGLQFHGVSLF